MFVRLRFFALVAATTLLLLAMPASAAAAAPLALSLTTQPAQATQARTATVAWKVTQGGRPAAGVRIDCRFDGAPIECASPRRLIGLREGAHVLVVVATKGWGRAALKDSAVVAWRVDNADPTTPSLTAPGAAWRQSARVAARGSIDRASGLDHYESQISTNDGVTWSGVAVGGGRTITTRGISQVRFRAVDNARNTGRWAVTELRIDPTAPSVHLIGSSDADPATGIHTISGASSDWHSGLAGVSVTFAGAGGSGTICSLTTGLSIWSCAWAPGSLAPGTYAIRATATDRAGNVSHHDGQVAVAAPVAAAIHVDDASAIASTGPAQSRGISLSRQPTGPVTVSASVSGNAGVSATFAGSNGAPVQFQIGDWSSARQLAIGGNHTDGICTNGAFTVQLTATGGGFDGVTKTIAGTFTDADCAAAFVLVGHDSLVVSEAGVTDSFTVRLATDPGMGVDVAFAGNAEVAVTGGATHTFSSANWNVAHTVSIAAVDDLGVAPSVAGSIVATSTSSNGSYDSGAIASPYAVTVTDDDVVADIVLDSAAAADTTGPGVDRGVTLSKAPSATVTVTAALSGNAGMNVEWASPDAGTSTTFTTANWADAKQLVVWGNDTDGVCTSGAFSVLLTATGGGFDGVTQTISGTFTDPDCSAGYEILGEDALNVTEGGATDTFTVRLLTDPVHDVDVTFAGDTEVTVTGGATHTFTSANWNVAHTVTLEAVDDADVDPGDPASITATSSSLNVSYETGTIASPYAVTVTNDDVDPSIVLDSSAPADTSGPNVYRSVSLSKAPSSTVTVTAALTGNAGMNVGWAWPEAGQATTFTAANWATPKQIVVWGNYTDGVCTSGAFSVLLTASGGGFDGLTETISGTFTDPDCSAGFEILGEDDLNVTEGGATDTFTVRLLSGPAHGVDVTFAGNVEVDVTGGATHTFTSANWNVPHTVTITAVDDADVDPGDPGSITATSDSLNGSYDAGTIPSPYAVTVTNDDVNPEIVLDSSAAADTSGPNVYRIVSLSKAPSSTVTVTAALSGNAGMNVGWASPETGQTTTFTTANWADPKLIVVWGNYTDGVCTSGAFSVLLTASGGGFDGVTQTISGTFTDPDCSAGFEILGEDALGVTEGGVTDTFTVRLLTNPAHGVDVTFVGNGEVAVTGGGTHTFTGANWNLPHTVTIMAIDDGDIDPGDAGSITATSSSLNGSYAAGKIPSPYAVTVTDNDAVVAPAFVITDPATAGVHLVRPGSETLQVRLNRAPSGPVSVAVAFGTEMVFDGVTLSTSSLSFTTANWNVDQPVTVSASSVYADCSGGGGGGSTGFVNFTASGSDFGGVYAQLSGSVSNGATTSQPCV